MQVKGHLVEISAATTDANQLTYQYKQVKRVLGPNLYNIKYILMMYKLELPLGDQAAAPDMYSN